MEHTIVFGTDTATLAVFDPAVLTSRMSDACDWWTDEFHVLPEVASGQVGLVSLSGDGVYKVRLTDDSLSDSETTYASERVILGLEVVSGNLFIGPGERLPSEDTSPDPANADESRFFATVSPGKYLLEITAIAWDDAPDWYVAPGLPVLEDTPADIVLRLVPLSSDVQFIPPQAEPRVFSQIDGWLFPELPRRLGPAPGMLLNTTVVRRRDELLLKPCGPLGYRPVLPSMAGLNWNDRIVVQVVAVNHETQEFTASFRGRDTAV